MNANRIQIASANIIEYNFLLHFRQHSILLCTYLLFPSLTHSLTHSCSQQRKRYTSWYMESRARKEKSHIQCINNPNNKPLFVQRRKTLSKCFVGWNKWHGWEMAAPMYKKIVKNCATWNHNFANVCAAIILLMNFQHVNLYLLQPSRFENFLIWFWIFTRRSRKQQ